jgi:hypothetical protein
MLHLRPLAPPHICLRLSIILDLRLEFRTSSLKQIRLLRPVSTVYPRTETV